MGVLIGYWNKKQGKSFPTVKLLSKQSRMSNSTVIKSLKHLTNSGLVLIVKDGKNGRQNYYINQQKFLNTKSNEKVTTGVTQKVIPCSNAYIYNKQNINIQKKPSFQIKSNDDDVINISKNNNFINKLDNLGFTDSQKIIDINGIIKIKKMFQILEQQNPDKPGAYLRALLNQKDNISHLKNNPCRSDCKTSDISKKLQAKYWKHIESGKIYQIRPDVGNHLLIKYFSDEKKVMILENAFIDSIDAFEVCENDLIQIDNTLSLTKEQRIKNLYDDGKFDEAKILQKIWKRPLIFERISGHV